MASGWQFDEDATPNPGEVGHMASVLEGRHGRYAAEIADFLCQWHAQQGDAGRSWAWAGVAERVRKAERRRVKQS